jgi:probable HAF family extracellular repeat protein
MRSLGFLSGGDQSRALVFSDSGEVVGTSTSSLGERAFVWTRKDGMRDLNNIIPQNSGIHLAEAHAINSKGQVVAFGIDRLDDHTDEGPGRLYLLTPGGNSNR